MFVQRVSRYTLTIFIILAAIKTHAQNNSWLKRDWEGRAYTLGNDPQNYNLILTVSSVKGKNFEGVIKAVDATNDSNKFTSKISGVVNDRYLYITIDTWKAKCSTCRPKVLEYSMESGRFFLKGEAKGCSTVECTWITEFSEALLKFNYGDQNILYAMADVEPPAPSTDTTVVAKNEKPVEVTPTAVKETTPPPPQRTPILPAGGVAAVEKNNSDVTSKTPSSLSSNTSIKVKQNGIPEKRLPVLPSGEVVAAGNNNDLSIAQKKSRDLSNAQSMSIRENPEKRIEVLPPGQIVSTEKNDTSATQNPRTSLNANSSLAVKQNEVPEKKFEVLPAGEVTLAAHANAIAMNKPAYPLKKNTSLQVKKNVVVPVPKTIAKDTVSALPTGYAERKKNVIKTLTVNTDSIMLRVYDNGVVDGDIVSVIYNDKVVIDKLSLTSHAVVVKIPVNKTGINTLVFHAHNLGEFPPNTALLEILYGTKKEELTVSSDLTVSSTIDIEYAQ